MANKKHRKEEGTELTDLDKVTANLLPESNFFDLKEIGKKAAENAEKEHIRNTLIYTNWNRKAAAKLLQSSYKALLYKIEKYHLNGLKNHKDDGK